MASMTESIDRIRGGVADFDFGGLVVSGVAAEDKTSSWRPLLVVGSIVLHAVAVCAILALPLLHESMLPEPAQGFDAIFVVPTLAAPPPPPPPPAPAAPARAASTAPQPRSSSDALMAPIEIPDAIENADDFDLGIEGGVAGGVEGGVEGGVVGGIVGGALEDKGPVKPMRVGGEIKEPKKLVNVAPAYPEEARRARIQGVVVLECTISPQGQVAAVQVLRGVPALNDAAVTAVKQWRYTPTLYGGVPVPVTMTVTVRFNLG